jgi:hypothetical protein
LLLPALLPATVAGILLLLAAALALSAAALLPATLAALTGLLFCWPP